MMPARHAQRSFAPDGEQWQPGSLDGITFELIVHRIQNPNEARGGPWLIRVYAAGEHVHSAEGGVPLEVGLSEARRAMGEWLAANGA